jgi:DNA-binding GntR family transcriptional regulator
MGKRTVSEELAEQLRAEIRRGELPPGTRLRQNEVAGRFGVSSTPVREAFAQLQAQGLVNIDRHRGAVVFNPTADDLREAHEIREVLEVLAVRKAVPNLNDADLTEMRRMLDEMETLGDDPRWVELNHEFHLRLYAAAAAPKLLELIRSFREATTAYLHMFASIRDAQHRGDDEHEAILAAAEAGDAEEAAKWTSLHVQNTVSTLLQVLDNDYDAEEANTNDANS